MPGPGYKRKRVRRPKGGHVRRDKAVRPPSRKDSGTGKTISATLGGRGVKRAVRAAARAREQGTPLPSTEAKPGLSAEEKKKQFLDPIRPSYRPSESKTDREVREALEEMAPTGVKVIRALTGDKPGTTKPSLEEIGNVATTLAGGGAGAFFKGALRGGKAAAKGREAAVKAAKKGERAPKGPRKGAAKKTAQRRRAAQEKRAQRKAKIEEKQAKKGRVVKKEAPRVERAKVRAKRAPDAAKRAPSRVKQRYSKPERALRRAERQERLTYRATDPTVGVVGTAAPIRRGAEATAEATAEDPLKVAGTTARVIPAMGTAALKLPIDIGVAAATQSTDPLKGHAKGLEEYAKSVAKIAGTDKEEAKRVVKEELGLIPAITAGLGGSMAARAATRKPATRTVGGTGLPSTPSTRKVTVRERRARRKVEKAKTPSARAEAKKQLRELPQARRERRQERLDVAREGAAARERRDVKFAREMDVSTPRVRPVKKRKRKGERRVEPYSPAQQPGRRRTKAVADTQPEFLARVQKLERKRVAGDISQGDLLNIASRTGWRTAAHVRAELPKAKANLREFSRDVDMDVKHTRRVLDALEENPSAIASKELHAAARQWRTIQRGRQVERQGKPPKITRTEFREAKDPEAAIRQFVEERKSPARTAELLPAARQHDIPATFERVPHELQGISRVKPRRGEDVTKALRQEARELRQRGDVARAEQIEAVVNRPRRAQRLDNEATKIAKDSPEAAAQMRKDAQQIRREHNKSQARLEDAMARDVLEAQRQQKLADPIWTPNVDVATRRGATAGVPEWRGLGKKDRRRLGTLLDEGRIDESAVSFTQNVLGKRAEMETRTMVRNFVNSQKMWEQSSLTTASNFGAKHARGEYRPGTVFFPTQVFNRHFQRGSWEEAMGTVKDAIQGNTRELRGVKDAKGLPVSKAALQEFHAQLGEWGTFIRGVRTAGRVQSVALLGLSPQWFAYQLIATPLAAGARAGANPLSWGRALKQRAKEWNDIPERQRIDFTSQYAGTTADAVILSDPSVGLAPAQLQRSANAARVGSKSHGGQFLSYLHDQARKGGPIIRANRKWEAEVRNLQALLEMDRAIRKPGEAMKLIQSIADSHTIATRQARQLLKLKNAPLAKKMEFFTGPQGRRLTKAVDDALGNWNALTKAERGAAAVTVFYPFLRFSLRWLTHTMPKGSPGRTAVLANLGQANAQELQKMLGGDPGFFPQWGNLVLHTGEGGAPSALLPMERAVPGSSATIEALFGDEGKVLQRASRPLQPAIGTALSLAAGQDPLSGRDIPLEDMPRRVGEFALGIPAPTRGLAKKVGGQTVYGKAFSEITGRKGKIGEYLMPRVLKGENEAKAVALGRLLDLKFEGEAKDRTPEVSARALQDWSRVEGSLSPDTRRELYEELKSIFTPSEKAPGGDVETFEQPPPRSLKDATRANLQGIPGIGPSTAEAIEKFLLKNPKARVKDLNRVDGIGPTTMKAIRENIGGTPLPHLTGPDFTTSPDRAAARDIARESAPTHLVGPDFGTRGTEKAKAPPEPPSEPSRSASTLSTPSAPTVDIPSPASAPAAPSAGTGGFAVPSLGSTSGASMTESALKEPALQAAVQSGDADAVRAIAPKLGLSKAATTALATLATSNFFGSSGGGRSGGFF